jgi:hypothetical protein
MKFPLLAIGAGLGLLLSPAFAQDNNQPAANSAAAAPIASDSNATPGVAPANANSGTAAAQPATPAPKPAPKPKVMPQKFGDCSGPAYIGHRTVTERYTEWGWIWKEKETYRKGRWAIIKETPDVAMIPSRFINNINGDDNTEYKLYGEFAPYKGYDPNYDLFVDVFIIKGFEVIGKADPVDLKPPLPSNKKRGSISSRSRGVDFDY